MKFIKIIIICICIYYLIYIPKKENFSDIEINEKATEIYNNRKLFKPGVTYTEIKRKIKWIDPIIYNDIYKLALTNELDISIIKNNISSNII